MREFAAASATFGVVLCLFFYYIGVLLKKRFNSPWVNPLLISIILTIVFLLVFHIDYDTFNGSAKYLSWFLTPATVALAIPLYMELDRLKKNFKAIFISIFVGTVISLTSIFLFALLFHFSHAQYVTFLPKSITTAIGMGISEELGGIVPITAAAILLTGITGNIIAESVLKICHVTDPIAKGLAIGTSSHAVGTSKAMEMGEVEGAMSSLSIVTAGIITVILANVYAMFL